MMFSRRHILAASAALAGVGASSAEAKKQPGVQSGADQTARLQGRIAAGEKTGAIINLPPGRFSVSGLNITAPVVLRGVPGRTILTTTKAETLLKITARGPVHLEGIIFDHTGNLKIKPGAPLVAVSGCEDITIRDCSFMGSTGIGLELVGCGGRVEDSRFAFAGDAGFFSIDATGLRVTGNHVHDCANNGLLIWSSKERGRDGSIVTGNRVERIASGSGDGQNGNGINVFRASNVTITNNRITDCAFSAIRNNGGPNCIISANSISRTDEVAIFVEFAFNGAVVSNNMIETVCFGISLTNLDVGGHLGVCANNVIRDVKGGFTDGVIQGGGIGAEGDVMVTGNIVENARDFGMVLGWGRWSRNLSATSNFIHNCPRAIMVSLSDGAAPVFIANNRIVGAKEAIIGMDHDKAITGDLAKPGADIPARINLSGNLVT